MTPITCLILVLAALLPSTELDPTSIVIPGVERALRIDKTLIVGASPSAESYPALHERGVRIVLSVDGKPPDLEALTAAGLRSIHLPIDYGGIDQERVRSLVRLAREHPESIYVHCHHGRHRAPAVAAVLWMLRTGAAPETAIGILEKAGTSEAYLGLWKAVRTHVRPKDDCTDAPLPERVAVAGVAASMLEIDRLRDDLDSWAERDSSASGDRAILLLEQLRELRRLDPDGHAVDRRWHADLEASITVAETLVLEVDRDGSTTARQALLERLDATCIGCHARHRR